MTTLEDGGQIAMLEWSARSARNAEPRLPPISGFSMVLQGDRLYLFGGASQRGPVNHLFALDLSTLEFTQLETESGPPPRTGHTAILHDGHMYVFGGSTEAQKCNDLWKYDINANQWEMVQSRLSPQARTGHSAVYREADDGMGACMYIFAGFGDGEYRNDLWRFDFREQRWELIQATLAPSARYAHTACIYGSQMLVVGGFKFTTAKHCLGDIWAFDFDTMEWEELATDGQFEPRDSHSAFVFRDSLIVLFGRADRGCSDSIDVLDLSTRTWHRRNLGTLDSTVTPLPRFSAGFAALPRSSQGAYIFIGGADDEGQRLDDMWLLSIQSLMKHSPTAHAHLSAFLPTPENNYQPPLSDVPFTVGSRVVRGHGNVISTRCPQLLQNPEVLAKFDLEVCTLLFHYLYTDHMPDEPLEPQVLVKLALLARSLDMKHLEHLAFIKFSTVLNASNLLDAMISIESAIEPLRSFARLSIEFLIENDSSLHESTLAKILALKLGVHIYTALKVSSYLTDWISVSSDAVTSWAKDMSRLCSALDQHFDDKDASMRLTGRSASLTHSAIASDFVIAVGSHRTNAHKIILATRCDFFQRFFQASEQNLYTIPEVLPIVEVPDVVDKFVKYCYLHIPPTLTLRSAFGLFVLCVHFGFDDKPLLETCMSVMTAGVPESDIYFLLRHIRPLISSDVIPLSEWQREVIVSLEQRAMESYWAASDTLRQAPELTLLSRDVLVDLLRRPVAGLIGTT